MNAILNAKLANIQSLIHVESVMVQRYTAENGAGTTVTEAQITAVQEAIDRKVQEYESALTGAPVRPTTTLSEQPVPAA